VANVEVLNFIPKSVRESNTLFRSFLHTTNRCLIRVVAQITSLNFAAKSTGEQFGLRFGYILLYLLYPQNCPGIHVSSYFNTAAGPCSQCCSRLRLALPPFFCTLGPPKSSYLIGRAEFLFPIKVPVLQTVEIYIFESADLSFVNSLGDCGSASHSH
jgi:hypothetical protein